MQKNGEKGGRLFLKLLLKPPLWFILLPPDPSCLQQTCSQTSLAPPSRFPTAHLRPVTVQTPPVHKVAQNQPKNMSQSWEVVTKESLTLHKSCVILI